MGRERDRDATAMMPGGLAGTAGRQAGALESDRDRSGAHKHAHKGDGERGSLVCSRRKMERLEKNNLKICVSERERERERDEQNRTLELEGACSAL